MTVDAVIQQWEIRPFVRGSTDCCAFADYVVRELTGESHLPQYEGDEGAFEIIREHGSLSCAVTASMGRKPVPFEDLEPGDVVHVTILAHEAIGVLMDSGKAAVVFEDATLRAVRPEFIDHGWKTWA